MIKILMGGSPCTYWSIAQTKNRETEASGMGWELFKNYLIAIEKYQPDYFLYENNKSMSAAIREQITKEFGFEPVMIDSALVSAQSRKRLYWLGRREPDGTYSRVNVELPEDRGILLRDILETGVAFREKAYTLDANYHKTTGAFNPKKQHSYSRLQAAEPINTTDDGKSQTIKAQYGKNSVANFFGYTSTYGATGVAEPINTTVNGKGFAVKAHYGRTGITEMLGGGGYFPASGVAEVVCENQDGQLQILAMDEKPIPLNMTETGKAQCLRATCYKDGIRNMIANEVDRRTCVAEPVRVCNIDGGSQGNRIYSVDAKSCAIKANSGGLGGHGQGLYAEPIRVGDLPNAAGEIKGSQSKRIYSIDGKSVPIQAGETAGGCSDTTSPRTGLIAEPVRIGTIESDAKNPDHDSQQYRVYGPDGKSVTLCGAGGGIGAKTGLYAVPICRSQCPSGKRPSEDLQKSCQGNAWTCPCQGARRGGADE